MTRPKSDAVRPGRYVYVVTRISRHEKVGTSVPNLGVHTGLSSASVHFRSVMDDRKTRGSNMVWHHPVQMSNWDGPCNVIEECYFVHPDGSTEELRIERWRSIHLKPKKRGRK